MAESEVLTTEQMVRVVVDALDERMGEQIVVLRMTEVLPITDYFVIATGKNNRHLDSMVELVEQRVKRRGHRVLHASGRESPTWVLLDLGDIVVHAFLPTTREYYDLEMRWADADRVARESLPEVPPLPEPPAPPSE